MVQFGVTRRSATLILILLAGILLFALPPFTSGQQEPPLTITVGRPDTTSNRNPATIVSAPGQDIFTVEVQLEGGFCPALPREQPVDVVLLIDVSTSMDEPTADGVQRLQAVKDAITGGFLGAEGFRLDGSLASDQVAVVSFSDSATVLSERIPVDEQGVPLPTPIAATAVDFAFVQSRAPLEGWVNDLDVIGGTSIDAGIAAAEQILDGASRNLAANAAPFVILLTDADRIDNDSQIIAQTEQLRRRIPGVRVVTIGFGPAVDETLLEQIADPGEVYLSENAADLLNQYDEIAQRIQPRLAANDIRLVYAVDTSRFVLREETINPAPLTVENGVITWPARDELLRGRGVSYTFEVQAVGPGAGMQVGNASAVYFPCEEQDEQAVSAQGPIVSVQVPTATPTATSTPTPTATFTPSPTPTATLPAFVTGENIPTAQSTGPGVTGALCEGGVWDFVPLIGALIVLLVMFYFIYRAFRRADLDSPDAGCMSWACLLTPVALAFFFVPLAYLLLQPLSNSLCTIPESVYFWRLDGASSGIYLTNENLAADDTPAQVESINDAASCVGCHTVSADAGLLASIAGAVPGEIAISELGSDTVELLQGIEGVYAAFAPDGSRLAISTGDNEIVVVDVNSGTTPVTLTAATNDTYGAIMPAWTSDSQQIAYVRAPRDQIRSGLIVDTSSEIYIVRADGTGDAAPLLDSALLPGLSYYPSFSPDGRWMAFTHHDGTVGTSYAADNADIWLLDLNTLTNSQPNVFPISVNSSVHSDSWPGWNRDGSRIAFNTTREDASFDIVVADLDPNTGATSNLVLMPGASQPGVFEHLPVWGPPAARVGFFDELLGLFTWPVLLLLGLPLLLAIAGVVLCMRRPKKEREPIEKDELPPLVRPPQPLEPSRNLPGWSGIDILWQPQPSLVIGVGNAGWQVLTQLKRTLADAGLGEVSDRVRLIGIIAGDEQDLIDEQNFSGVRLNPDSELVAWKDPLNEIIAGAEDDPALREWVDTRWLEQAPPAIRDPRSGFENNRFLGRLALINNVRGNRQYTNADLWQTLRNAAAAVQEQGILNVVLIGDTSDDVGSSAMLDVGYMLRRMQELEGGNLSTVRIIGHMLTERAVRGSAATEDMVRPLNTYAFLRELQRFQLAAGAPFPMRYSAPGTTSELDGEQRIRIFDEMYIHDGERRTGSLAGIPPEKGIYPAVADAIAMWLDTAAEQGNLNQWRSEMAANTLQAQQNRQQVLVSSIGVYQYRLPFADLMNEITTRYARDVLQYLLMGASTVPPAFDSTMVLDQSQGNDPQNLARKFLLQLEGSAEFDEQWRRLFKALRTSSVESQEAMQRTLRRLNVDQERDDLNWSNWLRQRVEVILNGERDPQTDPNVGAEQKRSAKISLAYDFLNYVGMEQNGLLANWANRVRMVDSDTEVVTQLERFAAFARILRDNMRTIAVALGVGSESGSLYTVLTQQSEAINQYRSKLAELETREYIRTDEEGNDLADVWYEQYLNQQVRFALAQMSWSFDDDMPVLSLLLPGNKDGDTREVIFDPDNVDEFAAALVEMGRYFAREVRNNESLSKILNAERLRDDLVQETVENMLRNSATMLGFSDDRAGAEAVRQGVVLSANRKIENADMLQQRLERRLPRKDDLRRLITTDPFTLTVVQTFDSIDLGLISSITRGRERYEQEIFDAPAGRRPQPTTVYGAEANALSYERRLQEIAEPRRVLHPVVVTALANRRRTQVYLLAAAAATAGDDAITPEWSFGMRSGLSVSMEELGERRELLSRDDLENVRICPLVDGLMIFTNSLEDTTVRGIYERYELDDDLLEALNTWEQNNGQAWRDLFTDCPDDLLNDLIALTRLFIRDILEV